MTTNASKFGLRAAAKERTNRHAQRTALPPKAGKVQDAKDAIAAAGATMAATATEEDPKSSAKAKAFADRSVALGWVAEVARRGDATEVTATRGPETIVQAWNEGVWSYEASVYVFADRSTKPRNASGAGRLLERTPEAAATEMQKVVANKSFRKREPADLVPMVLPFDIETATDGEVLKFLRGQTVRWYNRISRGTETAIVGRTTKLHLTEWEGEKIVNFCCPVTGFRSFRLSGVLAVGRGKSKSTPVGTVEVELEDAA